MNGYYMTPGGTLHKRQVSGDAVPVAVIAYEDREQVERLTRAIYGVAYPFTQRVDEVQAALREYADPKPPKPDEPTGHMAVVEDANGDRWVNWRDPRAAHQHERPWVNAGDSIQSREWDDIDAVTVLSEGVQP